MINLAARAGVRQSVENPWVYFETNVTGTLNLLELCREFGVKKFVLASTSSLYGNVQRSNVPTRQRPWFAVPAASSTGTRVEQGGKGYNSAPVLGLRLEVWDGETRPHHR